MDAGAALRVKHCLQMPVYPATLQHIPAPMQESVILTFGRQLKTSLQNVHKEGYGHNDIKAANVFISATGERQPVTSFVCVHAYLMCISTCFWTLCELICDVM